MNKEFIPYEQALELKELGFKEECLSYYEGESFSYHLATMTSGDDYIIPAPLYQQAFRWFREKHNIDGFVQIEPLNELYGFVVYNRNHNRFIEYDRNLSIEQAQLECLKKLIQSVKNK